MKTLRCRNCSIPSHKNIFFLAEISSNQDSTWWGEKSFLTELFFSSQTLLGLAQYAESVLLYNLESNQKISTSWKLSKYTQLNPLAVQYLLGKSVALNVLLVKQVLLNAKRFLTILSSRACQGLLNKGCFWEIRVWTFMLWWSFVQQSHNNLHSTCCAGLWLLLKKNSSQPKISLYVHTFVLGKVIII